MLVTIYFYFILLSERENHITFEATYSYFICQANYKGAGEINNTPHVVFPSLASSFAVELLSLLVFSIV